MGDRDVGQALHKNNGHHYIVRVCFDKVHSGVRSMKKTKKAMVFNAEEFVRGNDCWPEAGGERGATG